MPDARKILGRFTKVFCCYKSREEFTVTSPAFADSDPGSVKGPKNKLTMFKVSRTAPDKNRLDQIVENDLEDSEPSSYLG